MSYVSWSIELIDKVTPAGSKIQNKLLGIASSFGKLQGKAGKAFGGSALTKYRDKLNGVSGDMEKGIVRQFGPAALGAAVAYSGYQFVKAGAAALTFKENSLTAFQTLTGSAETANKLLEEAQVLGKMSPFDTQDVVKNYQQLLGAGFKGAELSKVFQGLGDAASIATSEDAMRESLKNMTRGIVQMKSKGVVSMEELRQQIMEASNGYIQQGPLFEEMAKQMGINASEVESAIRGGKVKADVGVFAIMSMMEKRSGKLGSVMEAQSKTVTGLWSGIKSAGFDFFAKIDLKGAGYKGLQGFLMNLLKVFDPASKSGEKLTNGLNSMMKLFGKMFGFFAGAEGEARLAGVFDVIATAAEWLTETIGYVFQAFDETSESMGMLKGTGDGAKSMFSAIGTIIQMAARALGVFAGVVAFAISGLAQFGNIDWDELFSFNTLFSGLFNLWALIPRTIIGIGLEIAETFFGMGETTVEGFINGIASMAGKAWDAVAGLAGGVMDAFKSKLGIHSPSKVFMQYGGNTAEGYSRGIDKGLPMANRSIASLGEGMPTMGATRAPGRGATNVTLNLSVDARGQDGEQIAAKLAELLPIQLQSAFEGLAIEAGAY